MVRLAHRKGHSDRDNRDPEADHHTMASSCGLPSRSEHINACTEPSPSLLVDPGAAIAGFAFMFCGSRTPSESVTTYPRSRRVVVGGVSGSMYNFWFYDFHVVTLPQPSRSCSDVQDRSGG